jgi:hypothetical protein
VTLARKGSRSIVVSGVAYRFAVSRWRRVSDWSPASAGIVDERWLAEARRFGLGDVANVTFTIAVERAERPASKLLVRYHSRIVDGFLGPEQLTSVTPAFIETLVTHALACGWNPAERGEFRLDVVDNSGRPARPALLVLPGVTRDDPSYERRVVPLRIL